MYTKEIVRQINISIICKLIVSFVFSILVFVFFKEVYLIELIAFFTFSFICISIKDLCRLVMIKIKKYSVSEAEEKSSNFIHVFYFILLIIVIISAFIHFY